MDYDSFYTNHGLLQTHPELTYNQATYQQKLNVELRKNPRLSSPEDCARACSVNEAPKTCYYHMTVESYNVLGAYVAIL